MAQDITLFEADDWKRMTKQAKKLKGFQGHIFVSTVASFFFAGSKPVWSK